MTTINQNNPKQTMTPNDIRLIQQAQTIPTSDWSDINRLIPLCDTEEAQTELHHLMVDGYHAEQYDTYHEL